MLTSWPTYCGSIVNGWPPARLVHGLRRVYMVTQKEREDRQLTALRKNLGQRRTRTLNKIHRIINRHNLIWDYPTKTFQTQAGRRWLEQRELPEIDRLEMDMLLDEWKTWDEQIAKVDEKIAQASKSSRTRQDPSARHKS